MRASDLLWNKDEQWLLAFVKNNPDDVLRLFLVYNDRKFGLDSAREIYDRVVGLDFFAVEESGIVSNEEIRTGEQQGIHHVAPVVPETGSTIGG